MKKPTGGRPEHREWGQASTFNLYWVDKEGHMFLIEDEQNLEIGTKEMLSTSLLCLPKK